MPRKWKDFPERFGKEANSTSGVAGLAGLGVTAIGAVVAAPVVTVIGVAVALSVTGWCAYKSIPPKMRLAQNVAGKVVRNLSELSLIHPPPKRIGVLGPTRVGKTTLLSHLQMQVHPGARTESPYACVVAIPGSSAYVALIDAAGQQYSQQFKVYDESDAVMVLLDHNESDASQDAIEVRLASHRDFLAQLTGHKLSSGREPAEIHFLMNKRDLWEPGKNAEELGVWFQGLVEGWRANTRSTVTSATHSNRHPDDLANVASILRGWTA